MVDYAGVSRRAIGSARLAHPVAVEPGRYTVIMEPQAVGDLCQLIAFYADARATDEGRSPFVKQGGGTKVGEKILDERISMYADPFDPMVRAQPYDGDGLPLGRQEFIKDGVLKTLYYSRFWAKKKRCNRPARHLVPDERRYVERGGHDQATPRGILVTRLWYLRRSIRARSLYTGLTRDGTFLIENGKITKAVKNFRFNDSTLFLLNNWRCSGGRSDWPGRKRAAPWSCRR
ncbi:MAG: hypothetical protein IPK33_25795 [Gemmatimonadetes bacterium]|nr:hypothetical protein [Gemmatimonadota bacterium]